MVDVRHSLTYGSLGRDHRSRLYVMAKQRLMTPGPAEVPETALLSMARQVTHHRAPEFRGLLAEVFAGLKYVFATENDVLVLTSSGTGAMEAAVVNLVPGGGKAIVLESGKFAERWRKICETFGIQVVRYEVPWGAPFEADEVARLLQQHPDAVAVFATLLETSTGVGHDIEAIGRVVGPSKALLVVDGISGVGVMECRTDAGVDVLSGHKGADDAAGFAFVYAWKQIESIRRPAFYFDLLAYRKCSRSPTRPHAGHPGEGRESADEGRRIEQIWTRAKVLAGLLGRSILGCDWSLPDRRRHDRRSPRGWTAKSFERLPTRFGVKLAGGQGPLRGRIFRIAHMGIGDELDVLSVLAALELVLVEMGQNVKLGAGVAAASRVFAEAVKG